MSLKTRSIFWESLSASQIFSSRCPGQLKIEIIIKRSRFRFSAKSEDIYWGLTSINPSNNYKKLFLVLFLFEAIWWERVFYSANSSLFLVRKFRNLKSLNHGCKQGLGSHFFLKIFIFLLWKFLSFLFWKFSGARPVLGLDAGSENPVLKLPGRAQQRRTKETRSQKLPGRTQLKFWP